MRKSRKRVRRRRHHAVAASPRRRRHSFKMAPRRKRRRGLSEIGLVKGPTGKIANPIIEGAIGGAGDMLINKGIPSTWLANPTIAPYAKWIKGVLMLVGAGVAAKMKQPLIAAGMAGGAAVMTMQNVGILNEGGMRNTRYANPNLLTEDLQYDPRTGKYYLAPGKSPYPSYKPLYDGRLLAGAPLLATNPADDLELRF